jgi:hypothetical protein
MNLLWLFLVLILAGVLFSWIEPLLTLPVYGADALALKLGKPIFYAVAAIGLLWQGYVLLGWSLIALLITRLFAMRPGVVHPWLYYILGFAECLSPVIYMASYPLRDRPGTGENIKMLVIAALAGGGFIAFAFVPSFTLPWLWFWRLL